METGGGGKFKLKRDRDGRTIRKALDSNLTDKKTMNIKDEQNTCMRINFTIYKILRIFYVSYFYYFFPFTVIWVPYLYEYGEKGQLERVHKFVVVDNFN